MSHLAVELSAIFGFFFDSLYGVRLSRSLKDEILHRVAIVDNQHVQQLCGEFKNYYNAE